jgi:hypothetical protein
MMIDDDDDDNNNNNNNNNNRRSPFTDGHLKFSMTVFSVISRR